MFNQDKKIYKFSKRIKFYQSKRIDYSIIENHRTKITALNLLKS